MGAALWLEELSLDEEQSGQSTPTMHDHHHHISVAIPVSSSSTSEEAIQASEWHQVKVGPDADADADVDDARGIGGGCCFQSSAERAKLEALIACQRMLIHTYIALSDNGLFRIGVPTLESGRPLSSLTHPIQDPTGALHLALFILRSNPPSGDIFEDDRPNRIKLLVRLALASLLSATQKLTSHTHGGVGSDAFAVHMVAAFKYPSEDLSSWPTETLKKVLLEGEARAVDLPLFRLWKNSPLTQLEELLLVELEDKRVAMGAAEEVRAVAPFLLTSVMMHRSDPSMFEKLCDIHGTRGLADAVLQLAVLLLAVSGREVAGEAEVSTEHVMEVAVSDTKRESAMRKVLIACTSLGARQLRIGPYAENFACWGTPTACSSCLSVSNLRRTMSKMVVLVAKKKQRLQTGWRPVLQ